MSQLLALTIVAVAGMVLVGYLYSVRALYGINSYTEVAIHTAVCFELLGLSLLLVEPQRGLMALVASDSAGGATVRRLLPAVVIVPVVIGWLRLSGQRAGLYGTELGLAMVVVSTVLVLSVLVWQNARSLMHLDEARRQAEDALRRKEQRYREFFDEDLAGVFITRSDGTIVDCNPAFVRIFGFASAEAALRTNAASLCPTPQEGERVLNRLRREMRIEALDLELRGPAGRPVQAILNLSGTLNAQGELTEIKGYVLDNTDRKKAEEQLRQSQRIDAIGRLAGGVAHDFNNLLGVIKGYDELLLRNMPRQEALVKYATEIGKAADRAAALTRQLLAFSRKQVLEPRVLDLNAVVLDMEGLLLRLIGEDIELVTRVHPDIHRVQADPGQVEQVIMNLAVNARDAMPKGGKLTIETGLVVLDEDYVRLHAEARAGRHVMLAVSDTGHGMDAAMQARIFEPFFTTKEKGQGTGLGLSTVHGIVKQSGGTIWVYSEPGQGTTFKVYLPSVEEAPRAAVAPTPAAEIPRGTETILLVEDEETLREIVREALEANGYTVLEAGHGAGALRICEAHAGAIHLIITDTVMPGLGGRELWERVRPLRRETRVLYMSGYTDDAVVRHGVLVGEVAFLQKPFTLDALARKVRAVLDSAPSGPC